MSRFLKEELRSLGAYVPGEQPREREYVKLNTNESPYAPGPLVLEAVNRDGLEDLRLYPDPDQVALREALALREKKIWGGVELTKDNIMVSNGSDDIINFAFMAFAGGDRYCVYPDISYGFYKVFADFQGVKSHVIPLEEDFTIDIAKYRGIRIDGQVPGLIAIANPNAPTGIFLGLTEIEEIVSSNPDSVVLIDEAYIDFGGESAAQLVPKYENLLVSRTYSKSASLAGARLGFALAGEPLIGDLETIKFATNPYSVNRLTEAVGLAVLQEPGYYINNCKKIIDTREKTKEELRKRGFYVTDSLGNFLFAGSGPWGEPQSRAAKITGQELYKKLKDKGVLVRWFNQERIGDFVRITIGSPKDMKKFIAVLDEII